MRKSLAILAVTAIAAFAASASANPRADTPEAAFERYKVEINSHDFDRLARDVIAEDAIFIFTDAEHRGLAEVRAAFNRTWSVIPDEVYTMSDAEWLAKDKDSALVAFRYGYRGTTKDGKPLSGGGRGTNLYRRTADGWRLAYEHLSHDPKPAAK